MALYGGLSKGILRNAKHHHKNDKLINSTCKNSVATASPSKSNNVNKHLNKIKIVVYLVNL